MTHRLARAAAAVALFALTAAVVAQPPKADPPSDHEKKAREAFLAGKGDAALKALQEAAKQNPTMMPPKVKLSRWLLEVKDGQRASRQMLEQAAIEDPTHPDVLLTNALYAVNEGRITDLILSCEAALAAAGTPRWDADTRKRFQREARTGLVAGFDARGDQNAVRTHLLALLEGDAKNSQFRRQLARANFLLNRPDDAFAELKTAHADDPAVNPPELEMALLWMQKGDFPKTEEWYAKAAKAHPNSAAVHRGHAGYWLDRGKIDAAKPHLDAAQKLDPKGRDTKGLIGLMARYQKDYTTATAIFEELAREHPNYPFGTANLALVLAESVEANQRRRAVALAETYVRQNPRLPEAHAVYGYTMYKNEQLADAEKELLTAAQLGSLSPDAAYFLALAFVKKERYEDAAKLLKDALGAQAAFVYRPEAQALAATVEKKLPPPKKP